MECEDAEQDELLLETAGDIIPHLGEAMDTNEFIHCMSELLPIMVEKLVMEISFVCCISSGLKGCIRLSFTSRKVHILSRRDRSSLVH